MANKDKNKKAEIIDNISFGTPEPNIQETTQEELDAQEQYEKMLMNIGQSTYEWAFYATKDEYVNHMLELYYALHPEKETESKIITPKKKEIILPN